VLAAGGVRCLVVPSDGQRWCVRGVEAGIGDTRPGCFPATVAVPRTASFPAAARL